MDYYHGDGEVLRETVNYMLNHGITEISLPQLELLYLPNGFPEPEPEPEPKGRALSNTKGLRTQTNEQEQQTGLISFCLDTTLGFYFKIIFDEFTIIVPEGDLPYGINPSDNSSVDISTFCFQGIVYAFIYERVDTAINQIITHHEEELGE